MGHMLTDKASQALKPWATTEPQYNVLRILQDYKGTPITVQDIQERMIQKSSNVTRIIDKLETRGWVNRSICEHNRRKMDVVITSIGSQNLRELDKQVHKIHYPFKQRLNEQEIRTLNKLLSKLNPES